MQRSYLLSIDFKVSSLTQWATQLNQQINQRICQAISTGNFLYDFIPFHLRLIIALSFFHLCCNSGMDILFFYQVYVKFFFSYLYIFKILYFITDP